MVGLRVIEVTSRRDLKTFIHLPWLVYEGQECWVPPLIADVKARLNRRKNPFFDHGEAAYFLAMEGDKAIGRIAAITNTLHNSTHHDTVGFFGWFECIDNADAAAALLDRASSWLQEKNCSAMRGPMSFSINDECGLLVDGFDKPPAILMSYNLPYYEQLLTQYGLREVMDLYSWRLPVREFGAERIGRIVKRVIARENLVVRQFDMSDLRGEIDRLKCLYNDAWEKNWGFVPMTDREIEHMARDLKPILEPRLGCFVEVDGKPVGFSLVLPDLNEITVHLNGRLFPLGFLKILRGIKHIRNIRLLAMGVSLKYQKRGLDAVLYYNSFEAALELEKEVSELGWTLATNTLMNNAIERMGGTIDKIYRLFESPLNAKS